MVKPTVIGSNAVRIITRKSVMLVLFALGTSPVLADSDRPLPPAQERAFLGAAETMKTADGATVMQVLEYAQTMRPDAFKIGAPHVGYDDTGNPGAALVDYWIGQKRLPGDAYTIIFEVHRKAGGDFVAVGDSKESDVKPGRPEPQIMKGRDAFLSWVDENYEMECVDPESGKKSC